MSYKKYGLTFIILLTFGIILCGFINIIIDPFFHYHKPLSFLNYKLNIDD